MLSLTVRNIWKNVWIINNGQYQLLKKNPTTKIKAKKLKHLKVLKDNEFIDNKCYCYMPFTLTFKVDNYRYYMVISHRRVIISS